MITDFSSLVVPSHSVGGYSSRQTEGCVLFPLTNDQLNEYFVIDGQTDYNCPRYRRGTRQADGHYFEQGWCSRCRRWEFSHGPSLIRRYSPAEVTLQHAAGQKLVRRAIWMGPAGVMLLFSIKNDGMAAREWMSRETGGRLNEVHADEKAYATQALSKMRKIFLVALFVLLIMVVTLVVYEK